MIVDRDFFTGSNVTQSKEQHVTMKCFHIGVRPARVVDIVGAVATAAAVQAPAAIDVADAKFGTTGPTLGFQIRNSFAGVLGDLSSARKTNGRETAPAVNW